MRGSNGRYKFENCWSFWNGYIPDTFSEAGNGLGFKLGGKTAPATTDILRYLYNSISFQNRTAGFDAQPDGSDLYFSTLYYNCSAYANGHYGFVCDWYSEADILKNCTSFLNGTKDFLYNSSTIFSNNSWNSGISITNADFISINTAGVDGVRETDGSLPKLDFLHLAAGSDLIDAGIDVGLPFYGTAPDIGYSEYISGLALPTSPVLENAVIESSAPSRIEITYNLTLANIVPASSAFTVTVNSSVRSISSVAISNTKVILNLESPVVYGDIVTFTYTKPSTNSLQTVAGGQATSITNKQVTLNIAAPSPEYVSSVIENSTPSRLEITYSLTMANLIPPASAFAVIVNSTARTISSVTLSGTKVVLTLASPVVFGDIVTFTYTKPSTNPLQSVAGGLAASVTNKPVLNNCAAPIANNPPAVIISSPTKGNTYMAPATITIDIEASDQDGNISKVELFNGAIKLGERTAAPYSFTLKDLPEGSYSLKAVATDDLKATTASSILDLQITSYNENREYFILYPNPNDGHFTIDFASPLITENYTITVFNLIGTTVYREELLKDNNVRQFDLSHLKAGTYVLMISCDQILLTQKFIKS